jgi:hypothetical protein
MKKLILLISFVCLITISGNVQAQRWPFGAANRVSLTLTNDTVVISTELKRGLNYYSYSTDTATVIQATNLSSELKTGDFVFFEVSNTGADNETVTFSTGLTGAAVTVTAAKTSIIGFVYNGTALKKYLTTQVN